MQKRDKFNRILKDVFKESGQEESQAMTQNLARGQEKATKSPKGKGKEMPEEELGDNSRDMCNRDMEKTQKENLFTWIKESEI